jgi:hypothetical protein
MSHPAQKLAVEANSEHSGTVEENTGRYAIDENRRSSLLLPPAGNPGEVAELENAAPLLELEPEALEEVDEKASVPPPPPVLSGVFSQRPPPPPPSTRPAPAKLTEDPEIVALANSFEPYYREQERKSERAGVKFDDLSMLPGNPYAASSLVPPPRKPFPVAKVALGVLAVAALTGGAWLIGRASVTVPAHTAATPRAARVQRAPAPQATAVAHTEQAAAEPKSAEAPAAVETPATVTPAQAPVAPRSVVIANTPARPLPAATPRAPESVVAAAKPAPATLPAEPVTTTAAPVPATTEPAATTPTTMPEQPQAIALPETPTREQVTAGFQAIREQLVQCAAGKHGVAQINATVANTGRVSYALIDGAFKGTPEGSCMARAVRTARFPQFSQANLKVAYPVAL